MSGNGSVVVPPDSTGKAVDCTSLSVGGVVAMRQRIIIADPTSSAGFATVTNSRLNVNVGTVDKISATVNVQGTVSIADGAAVNISTMPAVSLAAGTNQIGYLQKISAAVALASLNGLGKIDGISAAVSLASLNGLGKIDGISAAVVLAAGAAHVGEVNISLMPAVVLAAGAAHVGEVNISTMPAVALAAGVAHVGEVSVVGAVTVSNTINVNGGVAISGTASVVVGGFLDPSGQQRNVVDSANTALRVNVVAGGAGGGAVFGQVANGASLSTTNAPVLMGGNDSAGGGIARTFLVDTTGKQFVTGQVSVTGSVAISNTVTVQGQVSVTGQVAISNTVTVTGQVSVTGSVAISTIGAGTNTIGAVLIGSFIDASGSLKNVVDSVPSAIRVSLITASTTLAVSFAAGTAAVSINGAVALAAGVAHIGEVNISLMPAVALAAGAAHVGEVNISLMPAVVLGAGTANIGAVSLGAQIAGGTGVTSATTVVMVGGGAKLSGGAASSSAMPIWTDKFGRLITGVHPSIVASATHGPQSTSMTASGTVVLVLSGGAAVSIYVTGLLVTNGSGSMLQMKIFEGAHTASAEVMAFCAANGGGFNMSFNPPWQLSAGTSLGMNQLPGALTANVCVQFYLGPA